MAEPRCLVIIPTFNERENIQRIVPTVLEQDSCIDVLVVDDSSPDGTAGAVEELQAGCDRIHLLVRPEKQGLGRAYLDGFRWALERDYSLVVEMDADFSHPAKHLPQFIEKAKEFDVIIGSRYVGGRVNVINWPLSRLIISLFGSFYARTITRLPVADVTGGFNCFRREVLETIGLDRMQSNGYTFQIELKFRAWRKGFLLTEIPIVFAERESGESKMSKKIVREAIWKVWWLKILDIFGKL